MESPLPAYAERLTEFAEAFLDLSEQGPPPALLRDELRYLVELAEGLERDAPACAGEFSELAVDLIEELLTFRFRAENALSDLENEWIGRESNDRYWDICPDWIVDPLATAHVWNVVRLANRAHAYLCVYNPDAAGGSRVRLRVERKIKPNAKTLECLTLIRRDKITDVNMLDRRTKLGAGNIRQILSRERRGIYET